MRGRPAITFYTCPVCEACFSAASLQDGALLPAHAYRRTPCQGSGGAAEGPSRLVSPLAVPRKAPRCNDTATDTDHTYVCRLRPGHDGPHVDTRHPLHPTWPGEVAAVASAALDDRYDDRADCTACGHRRYLHRRQVRGGVNEGPYCCEAADCDCKRAD